MTFREYLIASIAANSIKRSWLGNWCFAGPAWIVDLADRIIFNMTIEDEWQTQIKHRAFSAEPRTVAFSEAKGTKRINVPKEYVDKLGWNRLKRVTVELQGNNIIIRKP